MKKEKTSLWLLFWTFAKMGVMTFGGGYAMLPTLQREVIDNRGWATEEELMDYFAIGQCTPGIIAVNTATFIGQKLRGVAGGITATLGVVFPSLVIISLLAGLITSFSHLAWVQDAFSGVQVCVCVLIFNAVVKLLKKSVIDKRTAGIFLIVLVGGVVLNISPVWFVVAAAAAGVILKNWEARSNESVSEAVLGVFQGWPVRCRRRHGHAPVSEGDRNRHRLVHLHGADEHAGGF